MQKILDLLKNLLKKHKQTIAIAIVAALSVYNLWATQQAPTRAELDALAPAARVTPTKPARGTATPLPSTATPTLAPSLTSTPMPVTSTPGATSTPVSADPCSHWHPYQVDLRYPGLGAFDYGVNPCDYLTVFDSPEFLEYLTAQNIDGFPLSSTTEEKDGYAWLYVRVGADGTQDMLPQAGEGCALFVNVAENLPEGAQCITNLLMRVHNPGDATHAKKRHHSTIVIARVCTLSNGKPVPPCGEVGTSGLEDWGVKHRPYKQQLCYDATTPMTVEGELYPFDLIGQPPYVAFQPARNGYAHQFISTITFNPVVEAYYMPDFPEFPNHIIRTSWNLQDAKEVFVCNDEPIPTGYKAVKFIVHALALYNLPAERPFHGFTTKNGYVDKTCEVIGFTCFPLWITETTPQGVPFLSYPVQFDGKNADGTSTGVVVQDFSP